ncbi:uncharacterized protein LOC132169761 [Corylus avellana]|uniref:uncharacterized protein LOC132169761 n=1 Tax=Corylus avellana TaxID=13451 RepID=UPI00286CBA06|nr:uncharacterized protein LOC132169761 [Corylus avellana]
MSILSWNCRGLGNSRTVSELRRLVNDKKPTIVFLMETKLRADHLERVRIRLGYDYLFAVDWVGRSGGLALMWVADIGIEIQNYSRRHISAKVCPSSIEPLWKFTRFYGHPDLSKRGESWSLLRYIARMEPGPWVCIGDFNEIISLDEKFGGSGRQRSLMEAFQRALEDCELSDLGYRGPKYTWSNCREGTDVTKERLDRAVANREWCDNFHDAELVIGAAAWSDHSPLLLTLRNYGRQQNGRRKFKYEVGWELDSKCRSIIQNSWKAQPIISTSQHVNPWSFLQSKIMYCTKALLKWRTDERGLLGKTLRDQYNILAMEQG